MQLKGHTKMTFQIQTKPNIEIGTYDTCVKGICNKLGNLISCLVYVNMFRP